MSASVPERGRHCWVLDPPPGRGRRPGLLTEWRRGPDGWTGLVLFIADSDAGPVLTQDWMDAARLVPVPLDAGR